MGPALFVESKKHASALTVFPAPAMPPTTYARTLTQVAAGLLRGGRSYIREVARTEIMTDPSGDSLSTMTELTVPHDSKKRKVQSHEETPHSKCAHRRGRGNRKQSG